MALHYNTRDVTVLISILAIIVTCEGGDRRLGVHELLASGDGGEGLLHWSEIQIMAITVIMVNDRSHIMIL